MSRRTRAPPAATFAEAGETGEIMSATLRFAKLDRWQTIFPWRDWLLGHQRGVSELVAREFAGHLRRTPGD